MKRIRNIIDQVSYRDGDIEPVCDSTIKRNTLAQGVPSNPVVDQEIMDSMNVVYFESGVDTNTLELNKIPPNPTIELISDIEEKLQRQLNVISKKLSEVILEKQPEYQKELRRVRELQLTLKTAIELCKNGKSYLLSVTIRPTLRLLRIAQLKKNLTSFHIALDTIKTLEHTDVRLRELLEDEDYPQAIQLCLECQKAAVTYKQYKCIKDLYSKLQDTIEVIEEQIDVALSKICVDFDDKVYAKLQHGYQLLGKRQTAVDQLLMHFTSSIHNAAFQVVLSYIRSSTSGEKTNPKKQLSDLCQNIETSVYLPCLISLCKTLWNIMDCYHKVSNWHFTEMRNLGSEETCQIEFDPRYIEQKLKHGRYRVWLDVQSRIKCYLLGTDMSSFKYDEFIKVLDIVKKLLLVGESFCNGLKSIEDDSELGMISKTPSVHQSLHEPIYQQSLSYFHAYHQKCMDELHMYLDNEAWEPCPMSSNFTLNQLPEFKFLVQANYYDIIRTSKDEKTNDPFFGATSKNHPFVEFEEEHDEEYSMNLPNLNTEIDSDEEVTEELLQDYVDEQTEDVSNTPLHHEKKVQQSGPILTNTALNLLRLCGKYLKMCDVLNLISMDVIVCMTNLFDYYLYAVYKFFVIEDESRPQCSEKLSATLRRIEKDIILHADPVDIEGQRKMSCSEYERARVPSPSLSEIIVLTRKADLFGFSHRITATESLNTLAQNFEKLKPKLEKMISSNKKAFIHQFYSQTVHVCSEVTSLVYYDIAAKSIDYEFILNRMSVIKWDIRDIMSQHSPYIDELLHQFRLLKVGFSNGTEGVIPPGEVISIIWKHCILLANKTLVEGYANVKKCSNEGRALMQLDFQQFLLKIDELTKVHPVPGKELVEGYIKAFYLTEEDLELWMNNHNEYSQKQLSALVHCSAASTVGNSNRKNKQKLLSLIEDLRGRR